MGWHQLKFDRAVSSYFLKIPHVGIQMHNAADK